MSSSDDGRLVFELTMGKYHVYFPDQECWLTSVPAWARDQWQIYLDACTEWCKNKNIPISITKNALVYELKPDEV